jgi:nicotinamidase/pyrazinamidase
MMNAIPPFYDPQRVGSLFYPELAAIADHAAAAGLSPATDDKRQIHLLIIDMQIDFCHPQGALYVPGAEDDIRRLIGFIYRHAAQISKITCSLDSHLPLQIFHPAWWVDENGRHPDPFTVISAADVQAGRWRPRRSADWSVQYVHKLEEAAKKALVIWPYHVPLGGIGNGLDPELWSAVFWHSIARQVQPNWWTKGTTPEVEHYSILKPEVLSSAPTRSKTSAACASRQLILAAGASRRQADESGAGSDDRRARPRPDPNSLRTSKGRRFCQPN